MSHKALVFGLQRSGTTFVSKLIKANFDALSRNVDYGPLFWKHRSTRPDKLPNDVPIFVVFKNPLFWIESVATRDPRDFYRTHPYDFSPDNAKDDVNGCSVFKLAVFWSDWFTAWVNPYEMKTLPVQYEHLLFPDRLETFLHIVEKWSGWERLHHPAKRPDRVRQSPNYNPAKDDPYYRGEAGLRSLTPKQVATVLKVTKDRTGKDFSLHARAQG